MRYQIFKWWDKTRLMSTLLILLLLSGLPTLTTPSLAETNQPNNPPEQVTLRSQQTLQDQSGNTWQATALYWLESEGAFTFYLRLEGVPGAVRISLDEALMVVTAQGQSLQAPNTSDEIFPNASPAPHLRQYDLSSILPQLSEHQPIRLSLSTDEGSAVDINVPADAVREWKNMSACGDLLCE